jgi:hypothetical protein
MALKVFKSLKEVDISGDAFNTPLPLGPEGILNGKLANGLT